MFLGKPAGGAGPWLAVVTPGGSGHCGQWAVGTLAVGIVEIYFIFIRPALQYDVFRKEDCVLFDKSGLNVF